MKINNPILIGILITFVYYVVLNGLLAIFIFNLSLEMSIDRNVQLINLGLNCIMGCIAFFIFKKVQFDRKKKANMRFKHFGMVVLIVLLVIIFENPINFFNQIIGINGIPEPRDITWNKILSFHFVEAIGIIVVGPIVEEIVYRGIILNLIKQKYSIILSLIISSVLFSLFHFNPLETDIPILITAFLSGIAFGFIYIKFGLIYSILGHSFFNFLWFVTVVWTKEYYDIIETLDFNVLYWIIVLSAFGIFMVILIKELKKQTRIRQLRKET